MAKSPLYALDGSPRFARDDDYGLTSTPIGMIAAVPLLSRELFSQRERWVASSLRSSQ
jgi:hypothetical protein